jgi:hypothetical protein
LIVDAVLRRQESAPAWLGAKQRIREAAPMGSTSISRLRS